MMRVMRIVAILLIGTMAATYATSADARRGKPHRILTKEQREERVRQRAEAERIEKERRAKEKIEDDARELEEYKACAEKTSVIARSYLESPAAAAADPTTTDEYLFRAYLATVKWDKECFEWKDVEAAKRVGKSLKDYVIGGVHPLLRQELKGLFDELRKEECRAGVKCNPGITSAFRDDYRQKIASGYKARTGRSMHGGSGVTSGWGDGRAIDAINIPDQILVQDDRFHATEAMWHHIDRLGSKFGIRRPMPEDDPVHLESTGRLRMFIVSGKRKIEEFLAKTGEVLGNAKENTQKVFDKFRKKKLKAKCRFRRKCGKR